MGPNRNLAGLSALVKDKQPEEQKDDSVVQLDSQESEGNEDETMRLQDGSKKVASDTMGDYKAVDQNQTNYSIE